MTRAFTRHARMAHRRRLIERTKYDGLEVTPIVGTGTQYLPWMALGLCFVLTCIGSATL